MGIKLIKSYIDDKGNWKIEFKASELRKELNKYNKMKKEKLYDPEKNSSFNMMFGFTQPYVYVYVPIVIRKERKYKQQAAETSGGMILENLKESENEN